MRFVFRNKLVSVRIGKVQSRAGSLTISTASASASLQVKGLIYPMAEKSLLDILLFRLSSHKSVTPQEDLGVSPGHSKCLRDPEYHTWAAALSSALSCSLGERLTGNWRHVGKRAIPQDLDHLPSALEGF